MQKNLKKTKNSIGKMRPNNALVPKNGTNYKYICHKKNLKLKEIN